MQSACAVLVVLLAITFGCDAPRVADTTDTEAQSATALKVDGSLRVLVLDDESLGNVLQREWRSISDYEIEVTHQTTSDFLAQLAGSMKRIESDAVIFPSSLLGQLVEQRLLRPMVKDAANDSEYRNGEIYNLIRRRETQWNRQPYAVTFGSPVLVMLRRTDLVPTAPETWKDLGQTIEELKQTLPADIKPFAQPMSKGWESRMLLARAASYLYDKDKLSTVFEFSSMKPRITSAAFVRAAQELTSQTQAIDATNATHGRDESHTPKTVLQEFLSGKTAIAITFLSTDRPDSVVEMVEFPVAISDVPGSRVRYVASGGTSAEVAREAVVRVTVHGLDGRLGAITRSAKNAALANIFLEWATGPEQSSGLCSRGEHAAPFRLSHKASAERWIPKALPANLSSEYVEISKAALNRSAAMQFPRLPSQYRYMMQLDEAVNEILKGTNSEEALESASLKWEVISNQLGVDSQKLTYRRSLGISTSSTQ